MKIALNARHMMTDRLEGVGTVTNELMSRIVANHPEDSFDYYFDRGYDQQFIHGPNVKGYAFFPPARLPFLIRYWMDHPVRSHIAKHRHDVFFSPDGFISKDLDVPVVTMVHDVAFLRNPMHITPSIRKFYARWMPIYIAQADHIITVSEFSKKEIMSGYGVTESRISVVYNGVSEKYSPLSDEEKEATGKTLAAGKPFFVYLGAIHPRKNILVLIRAFEQFKKNADLDYQLVIAGRPSWYTKEVYKAIESSPCKEDIRLTGFVNAATARLYMGNAVALIYPSRYEGFGLPVIEAMACGTPVMCSNVASLPEVAGDAALLFHPDDVDRICHGMEQLASDQLLRDDLIRKGRLRIKQFSWDKASGEVYDILKQFAGVK